MEQINSAVRNRVATLVCTPMIFKWSCGDSLEGVERLTSVTHALDHAKGQWICNDSWEFDGNDLEEGQGVVTIFCNYGQRLGGGLLRLTWICRFFVLVLNGDNAIVVVVLV